MLESGAPPPQDASETPYFPPWTRLGTPDFVITERLKSFPPGAPAISHPHMETPRWCPMACGALRGIAPASAVGARHPPANSASALLTLLLFLEHAKLASASGPLLLLFHLPKHCSHKPHPSSFNSGVTSSERPSLISYLSRRPNSFLIKFFPLHFGFFFLYSTPNIMSCIICFLRVFPTRI